MSRILEALRRIEETVREEFSVPPAADAGGPRAEESSLSRDQDGNVGGVPLPGVGESVDADDDASVAVPPGPVAEVAMPPTQGDASVFVPPDPVADVAVPPAPPTETQIVYSLEQARLQRDDARADPEPDPRFERLADLVVRGSPPGGHAVLMLTSPGTGEEKTRVTAALAEAIAAQTTGEVLAVEGDSGPPRLAAFLKSGDGGASRGAGGMAGVLAGEAAWQGSVRRTPWKRLDVLPGMKVAGGGAAMGTADLAALLDELRCNYQWVLLDAPSTACPETMSLARLCDGVLVVVELGRTGRRAAQQAVELLQDSGVNVLGCVATGA